MRFKAGRGSFTQHVPNTVKWCIRPYIAGKAETRLHISAHCISSIRLERSCAHDKPGSIRAFVPECSACTTEANPMPEAITVQEADIVD